MSDRLLSADGALVAVLWAGIAGFAVLHSVTLLESSGERTVSLIRIAWFLGLGVVVATGAYTVIRGDPSQFDAQGRP